MAGHSHWKQIKIQKGATDQKRAKLFSKLLAAITVAARGETNPQFNARLRTAIAKAKEGQVPQDNIERAIQKAASSSDQTTTMVIEAYGPGGSALIIEAISDNSNRTVNELKQIFKDHKAKMAAPGSVRWAFSAPNNETADWRAKFPEEFDRATKDKIDALLRALDDQNDIQGVYTNIKK